MVEAVKQEMEFNDRTSAGTGQQDKAQDAQEEIKVDYDENSKLLNKQNDSDDQSKQSRIESILSGKLPVNKDKDSDLNRVMTF